MTTLENVLKLHELLCNESRNIVSSKGHDYSGKNKDTLSNLRLAKEMGLVENDAQGIIVRLTDKLMRLSQLTKGGTTPKFESVKDTILDIINYSIYIYIVEDERCKNEREV